MSTSDFFELLAKPVIVSAHAYRFVCFKFLKNASRVFRDKDRNITRFRSVLQIEGKLSVFHPALRGFRSTSLRLSTTFTTPSRAAKGAHSAQARDKNQERAQSFFGEN